MYHIKYPKICLKGAVLPISIIKWEIMFIQFWNYKYESHELSTIVSELSLTSRGGKGEDDLEKYAFYMPIFTRK